MQTALSCDAEARTDYYRQLSKLSIWWEDPLCSTPLPQGLTKWEASSCCWSGVGLLSWSNWGALGIATSKEQLSELSLQGQHSWHGHIWVSPNNPGRELRPDSYLFANVLNLKTDHSFTLFPLIILLCGAKISVQGWGAAWSWQELSATATAKGSPSSALVPIDEFLPRSTGARCVLWLLCFSGCYVWSQE